MSCLTLHFYQDLKSINDWQIAKHIFCITTKYFCDLMICYNSNNHHFMALCSILPGFTHSHYPDHKLSFISFLHILRSIASSLFNLRAWQSFCTTSLQVLFGLPLGLAPPLHTPYISSPNHCLLFETHAHAIATCFAVVLRLCHLILVSLSTLYLDSFTLTSHTHLPTKVPPDFLFLQARSHFHATYYFAHNCCTICPHYQWYIHIGKQWYQPSRQVCKPEYLVPVPSQDKLGGLQQERHQA